jgi:hypothetical protein
MYHNTIMAISEKCIASITWDREKLRYISSKIWEKTRMTFSWLKVLGRMIRQEKEIKGIPFTIHQILCCVIVDILEVISPCLFLFFCLYFEIFSSVVNEKIGWGF